MGSKLQFIFFLLMICSYPSAHAQQTRTKQDSTKIYKDIEKYSKKRKFTKYLYKLLIEPITKNNKPKKKQKKEVVAVINYNKLEGKIIRKINITTLDPFGYSEKDTTQKPNKFIDRAGNFIHYKTNNLAILNLLLIKKNKPLDSLLVKESERLIRTQRYIRAVVIKTELVSKTSDSVDVFIRVLDAWSLIPDFTSSTSASNFKLTERNFLGTGHEFANSFQKSLKNNQNGYGTSYTIPNILNTYIKTTLSYEIDLDGNYNKYINIERPFYSAFTRWAGGINVGQQFRREVVIDANLVSTLNNFKTNSQDYWTGHSYQLFKGNSEIRRTTSLITSLRYYNNHYLEHPILNDTLGIYAGQKLYLMSVGISSRKFTQDKNLFNFNVVEDVASGFIYNLTGGYQQNNGSGRLYFGARFAFGRYFRFGYLSTNLEYGTFYKEKNTVQSAYVFKTIFFTNLQEFGDWKFRQFIKPEFTIGQNRLNDNADRITLNGDKGIPGFSSPTLFGTKKLLINFQTQGYSPWNVLGFRLNPYLSYTMGMLGDNVNDFKKSRVFSQFGIGLIVSNDYLVFSSFQISFSFYPSIPGVGDSIIKTNSFRSYDFGLQSFEISKPLVVPYP